MIADDSDLRVTVARIDERTRQIPDIVNRLEHLRESTVPMAEHRVLMERVETLWTHDVEGRAEWGYLVGSTHTLMDERTERIGADRQRGRVLTGLSVIVTLLIIYQALNAVGIHISIGHL